ncbi:hypothetical protein CDL15_Pgr027394 [Punica granatum]|uniref:Uncharacterized protein n=1 Tax=Punica granatum TaxID=22663 RepID=A0A218Y0Q7_PUNGR|nr:hypothetical protein CDL15_Pgr027394 [Punica granatum]
MVREDEVGQRRGVWRPRTAVPASGFRGDGTGDGGEHRLGYTMLRRGVTRLGSVGIKENFSGFWLGFRVFRRGIFRVQLSKIGGIRRGK